MSSAHMEQGMRQHMVASATMQLFMRALQANNMELEQIATQALATNPTLEELPPHPGAADFEASDRHSRFMESLPNEISLSEYLQEQILQSGYAEKIKIAAIELIGNLDSRGFFSEETPQQTAQRLSWSDKQMQQALQAVQELEPAGVGAHDLRESLLLQLTALGESKGIAAELISEYWDCLVHHRYAEAARAMELEEAAIIGAARRIAKLNPNPGSGFSQAERNVIVPDILVEREDEALSVELTNALIPRLALNADYRDMMAEKAENTQLRKYLSQCFREGRELIKAIAQRQETVLQVARAIVTHQRAFFLLGPTALAPLKMEQIAQDIDAHVSTISRAVNGKYLKCEHGVFELRSFFTAALAANNEPLGVDALSAGAVQSRIRALVDEEDKRKPLSDAKIEKILNDSGVSIARRTIAKYREQMKILPASLRKEH